MKFIYLSSALWPIAEHVARHYRQRKYAISTEVQASAASGFRPTLVCRKKWDLIAVEVRASPFIDDTLSEFVRGVLVRAEGLTIYLALSKERDGQEIALPASFVSKLREHGVGLLLVAKTIVEEHERGVRCSLRFNVSQGKTLRKHKTNVDDAVGKFNRGGFVDGLRDVTEIVEAALGELAGKAAEKRLVIPTPEEVEAMDFDGKINLLGAPDWKGQTQRRFLDENLKNDLKSFKGVRNLGHHPRNKKQQEALESQLLERMHGGIRLLREILSKKT